MFAFDKVFRGKEEFPLQSGPGRRRIYRQYPPYWIFPGAKNVLTGKSQALGVFLPD
jgi:hypothetical protein